MIPCSDVAAISSSLGQPLSMHKQTIPLGETNQFSPLFLDYLDKKEAMNPFYSLYPSLANFEKQIQAKKFDAHKREVLWKSVSSQYKNIQSHPELTILKAENTFTVTTGHQLNIFTGPLYVIYKLVTIINLTKALKAQYPQYNFIPVYWMATEDHDFEEINHFNLFGKTYTWNTEQKGAVGRMLPKEIDQLLAEMPEKVSLFEEAYLKHATLADATRYFVNELFGKEGLICIDADDKALKSLFTDVIKDDLLKHSAHKLVTEQSQKLEALGYKTQVNAREINFFYLDTHLRERIVQEGETYKVLNTDLSFSQTEMTELIDQEPERFSPNVILRPIYQETVLPNLAYIGGPAEVAYWLQLGTLLAHYDLPVPILMPRNFAMIITKANAKKIDKLGLSGQDLFRDDINLKRFFLDKNASASIELNSEVEDVEKLFGAIVSKAVILDKSLEGFVLAEKQKLLKSLENIDKRLKKAEEKNQETEINQLLNLKAKLFPNGGLQERSDNFLNFYLNNPHFLGQLLEVFEPLTFNFNILTE